MVQGTDMSMLPASDTRSPRNFDSVPTDRKSTGAATSAMARHRGAACGLVARKPNPARPLPLERALGAYIHPRRSGAVESEYGRHTRRCCQRYYSIPAPRSRRVHAAKGNSHHWPRLKGLFRLLRFVEARSETPNSSEYFIGRVLQHRDVSKQSHRPCPRSSQH